jgi:hypothetical protein
MLMDDAAFKRILGQLENTTLNKKSTHISLNP